jgi:hypothetical protein
MELLISTPKGNVRLTDPVAELPLPQGPDGDAPLLHYGSYLEALSRFFVEDHYHHLLQALEAFKGRTVRQDEIRRAFLVSEKHGALYQVARLGVELRDAKHTFAVNVATREDQRAFLRDELALLRNLCSEFDLPYLPRPVLRGEAHYVSPSGESRVFELMLTEWFEGFCEFHLSRRPREPGGLGIIVWDHESGERFLSAEQETSLYRRAAAILTAYFDTRSFAQIYPWHHAAGDFIVHHRSGNLEVRLITARGYRALGDFPASDDAVLIAALHFFLNMSLRLRLDRLDGTGDLAWADSRCLKGIVEGFAEAWEAKRSQHKTLPSAEHLLDALGQFSGEDWISFGQLVLEDGMVERDETEYLARHLPGHLEELSEFIRTLPHDIKSLLKS